MYKIKRFSVLSEKEFGEVKRANKAKKKAWEESLGKTGKASSLSSDSAANKIASSKGVNISSVKDNEIAVNKARSFIRRKNTRTLNDMNLTVNDSINIRSKSGHNRARLRGINRELKSNSVYKESLGGVKDKYIKNIEKAVSKKSTDSLGKNKKIALATGAAAATILGTSYMVKKLRDSRKDVSK